MSTVQAFSRWRRRPAGQQRGISLVELLVAMSIMSVITAMLLMGWFALSKSYGFSVHSADARDSGRQAMQRLQREVRDAEQPPPTILDGSGAIIYRASPYSIAFSTTFNDAGNSSAGWQTTPTPTAVPSSPHLVVYRLYKQDRELWRYEDLNGNGEILGISMSEGLPVFDVSEQVSGEGARLMLTDVVNCADSSDSNWTPIFKYSYYDSDGDLQSSSSMSGAARLAIIAVQLRLLVDLNPAKAPVHADLRGTAQLRNAR